jgi:hypothetical protein
LIESSLFLLLMDETNHIQRIRDNNNESNFLIMCHLCNICSTALYRSNPLKRRSYLVTNILALSIVSMLADLSTEMMQPVLPLFLVGTLGASYSFVGLIEGSSDSVNRFSGEYSKYKLNVPLYL